MDDENSVKKEFRKNMSQDKKNKFDEDKNIKEISPTNKAEITQKMKIMKPHRENESMRTLFIREFGTSNIELSFAKIINEKWINIFKKIPKTIWEDIEFDYNASVNTKVNIFPVYDKIFNFTNFCSPDDMKVVILGQDPYHGTFYNSSTDEFEPEATGLSFSIHPKCKIPPSLRSMFKNLLKYDHIDRMPENGCLERWASQGVVLLNSALTVEKKNANSYQKEWKKFTDCLINEISKSKNNIVFIIWGKEANIKSEQIQNKANHKFIVSSHPSGLSASKKYGEHKSFNDTDCFGKANEYLEELGLEKINW